MRLRRRTLREVDEGAALAGFWPEPPQPSSISPQRGPFALYARSAHAAGLVVIPTASHDAKRPLVRWGQLKRQSRISTVDRWSTKFPGANLAYLPAPSDLVVVDLDDRRAEDHVRALLGIEETSIVIASGKRGLHFPLRTEQPVPSLDLRRFGIEGEIKGAGSIVVGPGSVHPETGRAYNFVTGDWHSFRGAQPLDVRALENLIGRPVDQNQGLQPRGEQRNFPGRRNGSTFAHLRSLGAAGFLTSEGDSIAAARTYNAQHNDPPEEDAKVIATARSAWRYVMNGTCRAPRNDFYAGLTNLERATLRSLDADFDYADALALFIELKRLHAARMQRGETFALSATAMARARIIPGWSDRKRYLRVTRALLACGLIERVEQCVVERWTGSDGKSRRRGLRAAQYRFRHWRVSEKDVGTLRPDSGPN
jgi:Bifunctional DNA primase/polymerase, N-terminal